MKFTYSRLRPEAHQYAVSITLTDEAMTVETFKVTDHGVPGENIGPAWIGYTVSPVSLVHMPLTDLRELPMWSDKSVWSVHGWYPMRAGVGELTMQMVWRNLTAETYNTKAKPGRGLAGVTREDSMEIAPFFVYVPFKDSPISEFGIHVLTEHDEIPHLVNGKPAGERQHPQDARDALMPKILVSAPAAMGPGETTEFLVQVVKADGSLHDRDATVYLQPINGYLPLTRIEVKNGQGSGRAVALSLLPGESLRFKAGWRYFTGEADVSIEITND